MVCASCLGCCPSTLLLLSNVTSCYNTVKHLILELGPCEVTVSALRALIGLNGPNRPHLDTQPHRLCPVARYKVRNGHQVLS